MKASSIGFSVPNIAGSIPRKINKKIKLTRNTISTVIRVLRFSASQVLNSALSILRNVEGFLEFIHGRGIFWQQAADGSWSSKFWTWVNLDNLKLPPPDNTAPGQLRHWWWWRASRVVADFDLFGNFREVIDEFPFFSFLLADLHPHVLVIPFVMLALTFSLNMFLKPEEEFERRFHLFKFDYYFSPQTFLLGVVIFGGLGFLNIWDFPWYVVVFAGAHMLRKANQCGWNRDRLLEFVVIVLAFGVFGIVAYLPFYISFSSQAGGILPNLINPTRGINLWIMFGTLFLPLFSFLIYLTARRKKINSALRGLSMALFGVVLLFGFSLLLALLLGGQTEVVNGVEVHPFLQLYNAESVGQLIGEGLSRRGTAIFSALTLTTLLGLAFGAVWPGRDVEGEVTEEKLPSAHQFVVVMIIIAGLLVVVPEFIYLRDMFQTRMNTIFKFYYQGWILWALAGAYASAVLFSAPRKQLAGKIYPVVFVIALLVGLTYPAMGLHTRISSFSAQLEPALELDGTANNFYLSAEEHAAADWLNDAPTGTLGEAVHPYGGGSYTHYARISMNTGQPALLGWTGHEGQWRGGNQEMGSRQSDIERLYQTPSWQETAQIIDQYQIVYLVIGNLERNTYTVYEEKFVQNLTPVFQQGGITIYHTGLIEE